jgi:glycosyltransferase involved in cell wall biosynthesis
MVIISSGFHRTHVTIAAREAAVRHNLRLAITGAYPRPALKRLVRAAGLERGRIARLLEREEGIPPAQTRSLFVEELLDEAARVLTAAGPLKPASSKLDAACMRLYGSRAAREITQAARPGDVYHFRAGFGHASVRRAQELGVFALCDHAAVHPLLRDAVVGTDSFGSNIACAASPNDPVAEAILADIDAADAVVVNSDYVKEMFVHLGYPEDRLHLVYLGVDEAFLSYAREFRGERKELAPLRLLFAGRFDESKGAAVLIDALAQLGDLDWRLVVAGPVDRRTRRTRQPFFENPRVSVLGTVNRRELARQMSLAPVFVFPSLSEGSARVVFEALACGCYLVTTPSAGSIVEDAVHGAIVASGDSAALANAVSRAAADLDLLVEVGKRNAELVAEKYTHAHYGDTLSSLYRRLSPEGPETHPSRSAQSRTFFAPKSG